MVFHSLALSLALFGSISGLPQEPLLTNAEIDGLKDAAQTLIPYMGNHNITLGSPLSTTRSLDQQSIQIRFAEVEILAERFSKEWTSITLKPLKTSPMIVAWTDEIAREFAKSVVARIMPSETLAVSTDTRSSDLIYFFFRKNQNGFVVYNSGAHVCINFARGFVRSISRSKPPSSFRPAIVTWDKATLKQRAEEYVRSRETGNWKAHNDFEIGYFIPNCESNREYASAYHYTETDKRDSVQRIARLMATVWVEFAGPDAPASRNSRYVLTFDVEAGKLKMAVPVPPW